MKTVDEEQVISSEDVETGNDGKNNGKDVNADGKKGGGEVVPLSTFVNLKKEKQALQTQIDDLTGKLNKISEDEQKKKGDLEGVIKNKEAEIAALNAEKAALKVKAEELDALMADERKTIKEKMGDNWEEEFDTLPLVTLRKIVKKLESGGKIEPSGDGGVGNSGGGTKKELTAEERQEAAKMGLSEAGYLKFKTRQAEIKKQKEKEKK